MNDRERSMVPGGPGRRPAGPRRSGDFWKEAQRRYREASRLLDGISCGGCP